MRADVAKGSDDKPEIIPRAPICEFLEEDLDPGAGLDGVFRLVDAGHDDQGRWLQDFMLCE